MNKGRKLSAKFEEKSRKVRKKALRALFFACSADFLRELCGYDFSSPPDDRAHRGV